MSPARHRETRCPARNSSSCPPPPDARQIRRADEAGGAGLRGRPGPWSVVVVVVEHRSRRVRGGLNGRPRRSSRRHRRRGCPPRRPRHRQPPVERRRRPKPSGLRAGRRARPVLGLAAAPRSPRAAVPRAARSRLAPPARRGIRAAATSSRSLGCRSRARRRRFVFVRAPAGARVILAGPRCRLDRHHGRDVVPG